MPSEVRQRMQSFGATRSPYAWMTLRFSDCIRQVRVAVISVDELADLGACDAVSCHLLHGSTFEIRIAFVFMFRRHVELLACCEIFAVFALSTACLCCVGRHTPPPQTVRIPWARRLSASP